MVHIENAFYISRIIKFVVVINFQQLEFNLWTVFVRLVAYKVSKRKGFVVIFLRPWSVWLCQISILTYSPIMEYT